MVNMQKMLKQAQQMQAQMKEMQEKMGQETQEGSAGAGLVKVTISGHGNMKKVSVDKSLMDPEETEMLEDLIVAAFNDAKEKMDKKSAEAMSSMTGGFNIPGMKLPF